MRKTNGLVPPGWGEAKLIDRGRGTPGPTRHVFPALYGGERGRVDHGRGQMVVRIASSRVDERTAAADGPPPGEWHGALRRYFVAVAIGNLVWEFLQMPLYTIWPMGTWREIVFAAVHCTVGDILIALSCLTIALLLVSRGDWPASRFQTVAVTTTTLGVASTVFLEWLNVVVRAAWAYSDLMPVVPVFGFQIGVSPLLQWIIVPATALAWVQYGFVRSRSADPPASGASRRS